MMMTRILPLLCLAVLGACAENGEAQQGQDAGHHHVFSSWGGAIARS